MNRIILAISILVLISCKEKTSKVVENNHDFNLTFSTDCCGWTGGDGVYSVPLSDGRSIFIFGDTYLGEVNADNSRLNSTPAVKNSLVIWDNGKIETIIGKGAEKPQPYFQTSDPDSTWFWPGHGYEHNGMLTFFLTQFKASGTGVFGFEWVGTGIAKVKTKDLGKVEPEIRKWEHGTDIHFGMATLIENAEVYVFGVKAFRVYVAKAKLGTSEHWQYWDGQQWSSNSSEAQALEGIYTSEQFSVFKHKNQYIILSQGAMLGKEIFAYSSENMLEGWSKPIEIYLTTEPDTDSTLMTYNALAHPQFTRNDSLLISYCVNSTDFLSIYKDVNRYRPRFIRVPDAVIEIKSLPMNNPK